MKVSSLRCYKNTFPVLILHLILFCIFLLHLMPHWALSFRLSLFYLQLLTYFGKIILFADTLLFLFAISVSSILSIQTTCSSILGKLSWRRTGHASYKHFVTLCSSKRGTDQSIVCGRDFLHSDKNSQTHKSLILTSWHINLNHNGCWVCLMQLARPVMASKSFVQIWGFIK